MEKFEPTLINEADLAFLRRLKIKMMRQYFKSIKWFKKTFRMADKVTVVKLSSGAIVIHYHFEDKRIIKTLSPTTYELESKKKVIQQEVEVTE